MTSPNADLLPKPEVEVRRMLYFALVVCCLLQLAAAAVGDEDAEQRIRDCSSVRKMYGSKGFNEHNAPLEMIDGHGLMICKQQNSCCTREMEERLTLQGSLDVSQLLMDKLNVYRQNFATRLVKFDEYFVELINRSRSDLHEMFLSTYGLLYQQNVQMFVDLFQDLDSYYKKTTDIDIQDVLDRFFSLLMQRIFRLLNSEYSFSDGFFDCIGEHMNQLRPFGDIPMKLYLQTTRSFTAARVFVDGLAAGRDIVLAMSKLKHDHECLSEFMKLTYCSYCGGFPNIRPCTDSCLAVLENCVGYYANINRLWNTYLGEMQILATRLDGPFNIEMVISPLGVKVSEAIMVFQENSDSFSTKVFQGCGIPELRPQSGNGTRRKRESPAKSSNLDSVTVRSSHSVPEGFNHSIFGSVRISLNRLIRDAQSKLDAMQDIWKNLPNSLCEDAPLAESDETNSCWNGSSVLRKSDDVEEKLGVDEGLSDNLPHRHNNVIEKELYDLRAVISRIRSAHSGVNGEFPDNGNDDDDQSGSGDFSGSGSSGTDQPEQMQTTKDIYIDGSFSFLMRSSTDRHEPIISTTNRPPTASIASRIRVVGLQTGFIRSLATSILTFLFFLKG